MPARFLLLNLLVALAIPAVQAQSDGILLARPAPALSVDLGIGERPEPLGAERLVHVAGPRGRGALRGAKSGLIVGVAVSALLTAVGLGADISSGFDCDFVCAWQVAAAAGVAFTVATTGVGAAIGAATARPERVSPPTPEVP